MRIPTKARYGARVLAEVAMVYPVGLVSVRDIAERQQLSPKYLERIMRKLRTGGLVTGKRGMRGGYSLARAPETITLKDVFNAIEEPVTIVHCVANAESCPREPDCPTRQTWTEIRGALERVLQGTTIRDLVERRKGCPPESIATYNI